MSSSSQIPVHFLHFVSHKHTGSRKSTLFTHTYIAHTYIHTHTQILGAEKALFRALKSKHDTPKYGLIYHASLIGQAAPKHKGKISRVLAAKCALSIRVDALSQGDVPNVGFEHRLAVENRLRQLEGGTVTQLSGGSKGKASAKKYEAPAKQGGVGKGNKGYNDAADETSAKKKKKDKVCFCAIVMCPGMP
jgi:nucleolar protein 58